MISNDPKMIPSGSQTIPRETKPSQNAFLGDCLSPKGSDGVTKGPEGVPRGPKQAPKKSQETPRLPATKTSKLAQAFVKN